ncbi:MAG: 3-hydroxyacyl-CoA dehydrogenase NAD-binding domain-containing protein [Xanthobacteraceae bacterium]
MPIVETRRDGDIAVVIVDNPPVNAQNNAVRSGLLDAFVKAKGDAGISGVVLTCAGLTFIAGSDISEFGSSIQSPQTPDVIAAIEGVGKPVVAALFGTPMGGGFELALACHFRIAAPNTKMALPEIKLGLIPGAGGTQRLPRLASVEVAAGMILSGDPITADKAKACGLIDETFEGDPGAAGVAFLRRVIAEKRPLSLARDRDEKIAAFKSSGASFDELIAKSSKRGVGGPRAPQEAVKALRSAIEQPIDAALTKERAAFFALVDSAESKALRHIFFAERDVAKPANIPAGAKPHEIKRAAVLGAGTMGGGIAMSFANVGIPVTLVDQTNEALQRGLSVIEKNYSVSASRGAIAAGDVGKRMGLIKGTTNLSDVADADLIIEAVFEDMALKQEIFGKLDKLAKPGAILATNTSYLDVNVIAKSTARPEAVLGLHFFSPANVMRLLETVRGARTSPDVLATSLAVGKKIGKVPVVVGVGPGFVGNRMLRLRGVEAERVLLEGALPYELDAAMVQFGFAMGPLAVGDMGGLDIGFRSRKATGLKAPIADQICEMGRFGQKTGRGYYIYEKGSRTPKRDEEVEQLIVATSQKMGVTRRQFAPQEIVERLVFPMVNEGARILEEGIAERAGDIDVIWIHGYGFPTWRGGLMFYASTVGLPYVAERLTEFSKQTGDERHMPAPLLKKLAAEGKGFS